MQKMTTATMKMPVAEPKLIGSVLGSKGSLPEEWADWTFLDLCNDHADTHLDAPDVPWTCPDCGTQEMTNAVLVAVSPHARCDSCCKAPRTEDGSAEIVPVSYEKALEVIPPIYRATDPERLPYQQRQEVMGWNLQTTQKEKRKGLWIVGDTRTGKTRTMCLLLQQLIKQGTKVRCFFHGSFGDELVEVLRSERSFRAWKREVTRCDVLAIDDLFSSKVTERVEASVFEILDERIAWHRPTFVTTQITKKDALARFHSLKRCEAFYARIKEFFQIVPTGKPKQEKLPLK